MFIIVNEGSNGGKGAARWKQVEAALQRQGRPFQVCKTRSEAEGLSAVRRAAQEGHQTIVAAGGDGTVNSIANALLQEKSRATLGAIALGSSNDFHKPFQPERMLAGIPVRLDATPGSVVDAGRATLVDAEGNSRTRFFILNASAGAIAFGNAFFNQPDALLRWLKPRSTHLAILYAALTSIFRFKPITLSVAWDDGPAESIRISGLSLLKRVHFAGSMRYDTPVRPNDGTLDLNIWEAMSVFELLGMMSSLSKGKFLGRPKTRHARVRRVRLSAESPFDFELDGEVSSVQSVEISVEPSALRICE